MNKAIQKYMMLCVLLIHGVGGARQSSFTDSLNEELLQDYDVFSPIAPKEDVNIDHKKRRAYNRDDRKAARLVANYVVSQEFIEDVHALVARSAGPLKGYIRNYFFHCDFHKHQLENMKECLKEFELLLEESMPICVHALFSYVVSDVMKNHVQNTAQHALDTRGMAIYATPVIMDHIEEQNGVLSLQEKEQFSTMKTKWSAWYDKWHDFLEKLWVYKEARTELREEFFDIHEKSLLLSMVWKHVGPALLFFVSKFRIARIMLWSSVHDARYFLMHLLLRLHKNVMIQRDLLEENVVERTQESIELYCQILNEVIDERLAYFNA